jgi:hypothetical protein
LVGGAVGFQLGDGPIVSKFMFLTMKFVSFLVVFCVLESLSWFEEKRASCCIENEELIFS